MRYNQYDSMAKSPLSTDHFHRHERKTILVFFLFQIKTLYRLSKTEMNNKNTTSNKKTEDSCDGSCQCMRCNMPEGEFNTMINGAIKKYGFVSIPVVGDIYLFSYTIGLTESFNHPELIIVGRFGVELPAGLFTRIAKLIKEGKKLVDGVNQGGFIDYKIGGQKVDGKILCLPIKDEFKERFMGQAAERYGGFGKFTARQIIIADGNGKLPGEEGADKNWLKESSQFILQ